MSLDPTGLPAHLAALDAKWDDLLEDLQKADTKRREILRVHLEAYSSAYCTAPVAQSADSLRKQHAIGLTGSTGAELERWESEVRFIRDQLRALSEKTSIARSLYSGVKQAVT